MKPIPLSPFLKGLIASNQVLAQPKGSIARDSNLIYTERGALVTCDGTEILNWFDGAIQGPDAPVGPTPPPPLTPPCPPITIQSSKAQSSGANMTAVITLPGVTPGNTLVVFVAFFPSIPSASTVVVSDNQGDAFTGFLGSANFQQRFDCYGVLGTAVGGSTTITFTYNVSGTWVMHAVESTPATGQSSTITTDILASGTVTDSAFMPNPALLLKWGADFGNSLATSDSPVVVLQTSSQLHLVSTPAATSGTYATTWTGTADALKQLAAAIVGLMC